MGKLRCALAIASVIAASASGVIVTAGSADAAVPYCNNVSGVADGSGWSRYETYTNGSGYYTVGCDMNGLNENGTWGQRQAIKQIQWDLIKCYGQDISYDGQYGPNTRQAVRNVQRHLNRYNGAGLVDDGWAGPKTRKAMKHVAVEETFCHHVYSPAIEYGGWESLWVPDDLTPEQRRYTP